jgi:hypothetical protein
MKKWCDITKDQGLLSKYSNPAIIKLPPTKLNQNQGTKYSGDTR